MVDTLADCAAEGQRRGVALVAECGDFGGARLATDRGGDIAIDTGAARFTVREARFDGIDSAVVGTTTIIASGISFGPCLTGTAPGETTPPCTMLNTTANDQTSTATIEENSPVKTVRPQRFASGRTP